MNFGRTPVLDRLEGLRRSLMIAGGCWLLTFLALFPGAGAIYRWLAAPLQKVLPEGSSLVFLSPMEPVFTHLGVAAAAAFLVSLPVILWQVWTFLSAFHPGGRPLGAFFILGGCLCFGAGAWLAFEFVFPTIFRVLLRMGSSSGEIDAMLSMGAYLGLAVKMMLAFGLVFDLPVIMILLARTGLADRRWFAARRKYMLIVAFVFGAVASPGPDVLSQCSIAVPFVILYEIGILGCGLVGKGAAVGEGGTTPAVTV